MGVNSTSSGRFRFIVLAILGILHNARDIGCVGKFTRLAQIETRVVFLAKSKEGEQRTFDRQDTQQQCQKTITWSTTNNSGSLLQGGGALLDNKVRRE